MEQAGSASTVMSPLPRIRDRQEAACNASLLCAFVLAIGCGQGSGAAPAASTPSQAPPAKTATVIKRPAATESNRPLDKALSLAKSSLEALDEVKDYTCVFVKQERVDGQLLDEERLEMKVRHKPFSVYMRFIQPESLAGQEAIYVEGGNDGKLVAHANGLKGKVVGTIVLDPTGFLAMRNNRYPITNAGMKNLVTLLVQLGQRKDLLKDCRVEFIDDGKIGDRSCMLIEISNPRPVGDFRLAKAKIWLDREWNVPLGFESWEWPKRGKEPVLAERYQYLQVKFDQGLDDLDFDPANPEYAFP
jgi:hypothetical protein